MLQPVTNITRALLALLGTLVLPACENEAKDPGAPACAPGECPSPAAMDASTADGPASAPTTPAGGAHSGETLPPSSFVYYKDVKDSAGKFHRHIWTYDILTRTARELTDIDRAHTKIATIGGDRLAISPDRRWVAFISHFRPSREDDYLLGKTSAIWKVSADGRQLLRVSPPIPDPRPVCPPNGRCAGAAVYCNPIDNRCEPEGWLYGYEHPAWSHDGQTVFAHRYFGSCVRVSCLADPVSPLLPAIHYSGRAVSVVDRPGSAVRDLQEVGSLCSAWQPLPSPDGKSVLSQYDCVRGGSGLAISKPDGTEPVLIPSIFTGCTDRAWSRDGGGVYCAYKNQLLHMALGNQQRRVVLTFEPTVVVRKFAFSPDGRWLVLDTFDDQSKKLELSVADLSITPLGTEVSFETVIDDGASRFPSF